MSSVNLDALILREDFQVVGEGESVPEKASISIRELQRGEFFAAGLRKPDFQRETSEWEPKRVVGLIKTFVEDQLIPSVILWKNKDLIFVIDGSHRLSALIAWVQDDYGDGEMSRSFFGPSIPEEQEIIAKRTREQIAREIGSYADHQRAVVNPEAYGADILARARRLSTITLKLQWVHGDATKAEDSFARINQQAATITPQELELIKDRRKPVAIGARAVRQKGTGHQYWQNFTQERQVTIRSHAIEIHDLIFSPTLHYPVKSLDLPAGGSVAASTALRMIYDFISISVVTSDNKDDVDGTRTIDALIRAKKLAKIILSNDSPSLGLHPAVYFYSWTGKQLPVTFLAISELMSVLERHQQFDVFIERRALFEDFLIDNRALLNQIIRKYGSGASGRKNLLHFYQDVLNAVPSGGTGREILDRIKAGGKYSYLQPEETSYDGVSPTRFSTQVKSGIVIQNLLQTAPKCRICNAIIPAKAISVDHTVRRADGGPSTVDNAGLTHPYCNTGYKERAVHLARKAAIPSVR